MTEEEKLLAEFDKEQEKALKQMQDEMLKEVEKDLEPMYRQARKEWRQWKKEQADAERQAHLRGEYTEADYQRDLALYLEAVKNQKQR